MNNKSGFWALLSAMRTELLLMALCALCFLLALAAPLRFAGAEGGPYTAEEAALRSACESGQLIRLHILADSDSPEAQRVKLLVRDALLAAFADTLREAGGQSADAVYEALRQNVEAMAQVASGCARANGFTGSVTAQVGRLRLPEKRYGQVLLPEGEYRCLRVTLGSGAGQNWWCVLFPQLCLAIAEDGAQEGESREPEGKSTASAEAKPLGPSAEKETDRMTMRGREINWASADIFDKWLAVAPTTAEASPRQE